MMNSICPECGHGTSREIRPYTIKYKGLTSTFDMPGEYCTQCDEAVFTGKDLQVSDRELRRLKALTEGLLLPEQIRTIRKKLRVTQSEAGTIIGGGPNAFHKYESGLLLPSHAVCTALRVLNNHPEELVNLRKPIPPTFSHPTNMALSTGDG